MLGEVVEIGELLLELVRGDPVLLDYLDAVPQDEGELGREVFSKLDYVVFILVAVNHLLKCGAVRGIFVVQQFVEDNSKGV